MRHTNLEIYDDIHLAQLLNSKPRRAPRPWWHWTLLVVAVGLAVLAPLAWWLGAVPINTFSSGPRKQQ